MSSMSSSLLPEELCADIFLRLPVKSILSCRHVCAFWRNLIRSPDFIKSHLKIQRNNPRLMFNDNHMDTGNPFVYSIDYASISLEQFQSCQDVRSQTVLENHPFQYEETSWVDTALHILGSCNGLLCLLLDTSDDQHRICMWNPCTREYKEIPVDPIRRRRAAADDHVDRYNVRYGFGWDCNTNDYKVVRIANIEETSNFTFQVYTLESDSWKTIELGPYSFPTYGNVPGLFLNGALHWLAFYTTDGGASSSEVIVSFDMSSYRFSDMLFLEEHLPYLEDDHKLSKTIGVVEDCLCLVVVDQCVRTDIWVMQEYGVRESWVERFTTTESTITNHRILKPLWSFENKILMYNGETIVLLDIEMDDAGFDLAIYYTYKDITRFHPAVNHIETLVSLNSGTYVAKRIMKEPLYESGDLDENIIALVRLLYKDTCLKQLKQVDVEGDDDGYDDGFQHMKISWDESSGEDEEEEHVEINWDELSGEDEEEDY